MVAPDITQELESLLEQNGGTWCETEYRESHLQGNQLVVAATPDKRVNERVYLHACARAIQVNVVDAPQLCTFIFPSIVDRDPLVVAITSSGRSPVLARILRRKIEALLPAAYGDLARFAGTFRENVKAKLPVDSARRLFWEKILEGSVAEQVFAGRLQDAETQLLENLEGVGRCSGEVYLVGAGPGNPDLLTFKAARLLQCADVVLYDRLVSQEVVDIARRDADRIYVGKRRADHSVAQQDINQLLVDLAMEGKRVVRLKGGDPFIFGRGGEEIELLAQHRIPFQVVPGVSAANGAACYAGIPLTHRDHAQSVRFVAGYLKGDKVEHDWASLQSDSETLVFYMGLMGLPVICEQLQAHGRAAETPVALIEQGTRMAQRVLVGTLETIVAIVERERPAAPTLIIVGPVVKLHGTLSWFGQAAEDEQ